VVALQNGITTRDAQIIELTARIADLQQTLDWQLLHTSSDQISSNLGQNGDAGTYVEAFKPLLPRCGHVTRGSSAGVPIGRRRWRCRPRGYPPPYRRRLNSTIYATLFTGCWIHTSSCVAVNTKLILEYMRENIQIDTEMMTIQ
jgi:hypothetical protein